MTNVDWTAWGPAGLFAIFTLVLLKVFLDFLGKRDDTILTMLTHMTATLVKIDSNMDRLAEAMIKHDTSVQSTVSTMVRFATQQQRDEPEKP